MSTRTSARAVTAAPPVSSAVFDWTFTLLCVVFLGGVFLDGWAHLGGPFDLAWHSVFGFEADVEALMSPAHSVLAIGFALIASGPLRAALRRPPRRWLAELPMVLAMAFVVSTLTFFTQTAHPLANLWGAGNLRASYDVIELGLVSLVLSAAVLTAPVLLLLGLGRLPAGAVTIVIGVSSIATGVLFDHGDYPLAQVVALVAAAVAADLLRAWLRPRADRPGTLRAFAAMLPAALLGAYFLSLRLTVGVTWSAHLALGTVVFGAVVGWLFSYFVAPPRLAKPVTGS
jgi:hypothetical protein